MSDPFGGFDPRMFEQVPLFRELAKVMSWTGGPVNWELAAQTAGALADPDGEAPRGDREHEELASAVDTAELWLDQVTELPRVDGVARALTRVEWTRLAATPEGLGTYVEPIAAGASEGLAEHLPEELRGALGPAAGNPLAQAMGSLGAMLYGMQTGTIAGHLAGQLLSTYELGVPTIDPRTVGTIGDTAERFAADYDFDVVEFRHWIALHEAAHRRQYAGVPWLRKELAALVRRFAAEADTDPSALFDRLGELGLDPNDPSSLQRALEGGSEAFSVEPSAGQRQVLDRLQAVISFVIAWVDTVVGAAAGDKLTALPRIDEAMRRRQAEQGPGERFLTQLIGLDLTPGAVREARAFCEAVIAARGQEGLDRVWRDPAFLPGPGELSEPSRWLVRMAAAELEEGEEQD